MINKTIIFFGFLFGLGSLVLSFIPNLDFLRWFLGLGFVYFFAGYPFSLILFEKNRSFLDRTVVSSGLSLLLTYPSGFLNVVYEGQSHQAIFGKHLSGDLFFLILFYGVTSLVWFVFAAKNGNRVKNKEKLGWYWLIPIILAVLFNFYKLGVPDLNGDEYDLGYQAYNLVDGIFAGRKAYVLSFSAHPPLSNYIQHYTMNILSPSGLDSLSDGMFRVGPALVGVITTVVVYLLAMEMGLGKLGLVAASLLAVNGYQTFISRVFHREGFLTLFVVLTLYIFVRYIRSKYFQHLFLAGIFFGAAMLTKASALVILPVIFAMLWWYDRRNFIHSSKKFLLTAGVLFLPVIIYNLSAYVTTGYTDVFFSRIFQTPTHPGARIVNASVIQNLQNILLIGLDQYGILAFAMVGVSTVASLLTAKDKWNRFFLAWVASMLLFFGINGVRVYYLPFITVPLLMLTVIMLNKYVKSKILLTTITVVLFAVSFARSSETFFDYSFVSQLKDNDEIPSIREIIQYSYSLTSRRWLENRGWKNLRSDLNQIYTPNVCLVIYPNISSLSLRRYLEQDDEIKRFYLGQQYIEPYRVCGDTTVSSRVSIRYDQGGIVRANLL